MIRFDLAAMALRARPALRRRGSLTLRDIAPPAVLATDLWLSGYKPAVDLWTRHAERIVAEYARTLSALTTDAPADLTAALDQAEGEFSRLVLLLRPAMRAWTIAVEKWQRSKWRGAVLSATGVDLATLLGPADVAESLETVLERNVGLVVDVSRQARQRIESAVFDGLRARAPARDVARTIREATGMARDRSVRIANDQLTKLTSSIADERRRQAGIDTWEWVHSRKLHPRREHQARNGKVYAETAAGADPVKGVLPPPPTRPGEEPFCGCRALARLDFPDD